MLGILGIGKHERTRILLSSYVDGEVTEDEARRVEAHLEGCHECQVELEELRATVSLLSQLPQLEPSRSFRLIEQPEPLRETPSFAWGGALATSIAGVLLIALVLGDALGLVSQSGELAESAVFDSAVTEESAVVAGAAAAPMAPAAQVESVQADAPVAAPAAPAPSSAQRLAPEPTSAPPLAAAAALPPPTAESDGAESAVTAQASAEEAKVDDGQSQALAEAPVPAAALAPAPGAPVAIESAAAPAPEPIGALDDHDDAIELPLWQLQLGVSIVLAALALATIWAIRRRRQ